MSNVSNSTSAAASNCVVLPDSLQTSQRLVVIYLFFRQWSGTVTVKRSDYSHAVPDDQLPPEDVIADYGQKRIIDPIHLRIFSTLKKRAEAVLDRKGLPFCKGMVVPIDAAPQVVDDLRQIAEEYNAVRDAFIADFDAYCQEWAKKHEGTMLPVLTSGDIAERINADFAVFQFQPLGQDIDKTASLDRTVNSLFGEVIRDVSKKARLLRKNSLEGKTADDLTQKTLSTIRGLRDKLSGLVFLNLGVKPILELVCRILEIMPSKGKFSTNQFNALYAALGVLSDEALLNEVADGKLTLDQYLSNAFPNISMSGGSSLCIHGAATPVLPSAAQPTDQTEPAADTSFEAPAAVASADPDAGAEADADSVAPAPAVPCASVASTKEAELPVQTPEMTSEGNAAKELLEPMERKESMEPLEPAVGPSDSQPETEPDPAQQELLARMLQECFGITGDAQKEELTEQGSESESKSPAESLPETQGSPIPPPPEEIRLSYF